jgi:hypothetical protein
MRLSGDLTSKNELFNEYQHLKETHHSKAFQNIVDKKLMFVILFLIKTALAH